MPCFTGVLFFRTTILCWKLSLNCLGKQSKVSRLTQLNEDDGEW